VTRSRRLRWAAGALAVGALAVSQAVAGTAATALGAAARPAVHGGSGMIPAIGTHPPRQKAGAVTPGLQPNYPLIFNCQKPTASVTCYGPDQIRTAYGFDTLINAGYTGKGRTIVIVDAFSDPALRRDLRIFNQVFNLPGANLTVVAPDGETAFDPSDPNQVGWSGEIALDVEYSHAMAPGAKIVLVEAKSNQDSDLQSALQYVADNNLGDVVSQSFGEAENCLGVNADGTHQPGVTLAAAHRQYKQMTDEGMTVFASAGDQGSAQPTCDGSGFLLSASTPASDPLVTGVGGTQLFANPRTGAYDHEVVWNETRTFGDAGGGGFSSHFAQPGYQHGLGDFPGRGVPDVAYSGAIDGGVLVAWSVQDPPGTFYIFGGTSAGSPQWAALAAITDQLNHGRIGNINPALYKMPGDFHDITRGNNAFPGVPGYTAARGWDPASGLGTPYAGAIALGLAAAAS
jgi:subtilase family serine protease